MLSVLIKLFAVELLKSTHNMFSCGNKWQTYLNAPLIWSYEFNRFWLCWGLTTRQPLRVILCRLPEKGRKEIEERVEEMKERDREERGIGKKVKKQKK